MVRVTRWPRPLLALPAWESYEPSDAFDGGVLGGAQLRKMLEVLSTHIVDESGAGPGLAEEVARARSLGRARVVSMSRRPPVLRKRTAR